MLAQLPQWNLFPAVLRGKIRLKGSTATNPVAVGDRVTFEADIPEDALMCKEPYDSSDGGSGSHDGQIMLDAGGRSYPLEYLNLENPAAITAVAPRTNYIIRKSTNLSRQSHRSITPS